MKMILTKAPALEPVSAARIRAGLGTCTPRDDTLLSCLVTAARVVLEARTGLVFLPQTWTLRYDGPWDDDGLALPIAPVRKLLSARLHGAAGSSVTVKRGRIRLAANGAKQRLVFDDAGLMEAGRMAAVLEVDVGAGLADRPRDLPTPLRQAVADLAVHWFTSRQTVAFGDQTVEIPKAIARSVAPFAAHTVH